MGTQRHIVQNKQVVGARLVRWGAGLVMYAYLVWPAAASAATGEQVGKNLGDLLGAWAKNLYAGIAGLVAVMFLFNRRFAELAVFVVAAVVVGGFVLAPGEVAATVRGIWNTLTG